jgi:serine protease Do
MNVRQVVAWLVSLGATIGMVLYIPTLAGRINYARTAAQVRAIREELDRPFRGDAVSSVFRLVSKAVQPAVVVIRTSQQMRLRPDDPRDFLQRFFDEEGTPGDPVEPDYYVREGIGSGIVVDAQNGYVLTSRHVVRGAETAVVMLADGRVAEARWARSDPRSDLAIVKIDPIDLVSVPLGNSDDVEVGDWVLAVGAPEGLPQTVTSGIISAKGRVAGDDGESFLQTDAAINPGNSGGPLVNMRGEVIGINTAIISPVGANAGIGLAIPSNVAKKVMVDLTSQPESAPSELNSQPQHGNTKGAKRWAMGN